jgi:alkyl hydroperoxide reductase subunit AhpC
MIDATSAVGMGQVVPAVEMPCYDPVSDDFATFSLAEQVGRGRWTILFFYPGDFTFV